MASRVERSSTMPWARAQVPLASHQSAASGAGNSRGGSTSASEALNPSNLMLRLYHPSQFAAKLRIEPVSCDLSHLQIKYTLLQLNHRSDEVSRGSARGLGRGWGIPGQQSPSWRPIHGTARHQNPRQSGLQPEAISPYTEIRPFWSHFQIAAISAARGGEAGERAERIESGRTR